ncbi:MAG: leucyl/phenylalanyl-tRNA--protein transferase [Gammaproteobacteria bacterium]|nr:leucyl/phenylalanyl-tRNA--protein transferase [Gammaproteobacteria bacterium]
MQTPYYIQPHDTGFPDATLALRDPDGLLAVGGDLAPQRLIEAYRNGIFPWYATGQPVLWWSPDPRAVLFPEHFRIARSLRKLLRQHRYSVTYDTCFTAVMEACAAPRNADTDTWITVDMIDAYSELHRLGHAHSTEVWHRGELVGGLYGVALGRVFFAESMFSRHANTSKVALAHLTARLHQQGYRLIDCQMHTPHLASLGAEKLPRHEFIRLLQQWRDMPPLATPWDNPGYRPHEHA